MSRGPLYNRVAAQTLSSKQDFVTAYSQWYDEIVPTTERAAVHYWYSPEFNAIWSELWQAYDDLELRRIQSSLQHPMLWKDEVAELKTYQRSKHKESYYPMQEDFWRVCPLWVHLERKLPERANGDRRHTWGATLENWESFVDSHKSDSFRESLSGPQRSSFDILMDWWHSRYNNTTLAEAAKSYMRERVNTVATALTSSLKECAAKGLSLYHSYCFELFAYEFNPSYWEPYKSYDFLHGLQRLRHDAARYAVTQRIVFSNFGPRMSPQTDYPVITLNDTTWRESLLASGLPYYLWDNNNQKTIQVSELSMTPEYTCVSHTWGRWREDSAVMVDGVPWPVPENTIYDVRDLPTQLSRLNACYIWFDLLCIPQKDSSRLKDVEISRQSTIFRGSTACIAWLHDVEGWAGVKQGIRWLGLNYLLATTDPRTSDTARITSHTNMQKAWEEADIQAELVYLPRRTESIGPSELRRLVAPNHWFTSLWTFQEALLCPGIELYSENWSRLEDDLGCPIGLASLAAFVRLAGSFIGAKAPMNVRMADPDRFLDALRSRAKETKHSSTDVPLAASNLLKLFDLTSMETVLHGRSPAKTFIAASMRECTDDRAPALMSAIGVTDWFKPRSRWRPRLRVFDRKIQGLYQLEFVQAAFEQFRSALLQGTWFENRRLEEQDLRKRTSFGSMMPFSKEDDRSDGTLDVSRRGENVGRVNLELMHHPSLSCWKIRADGSIRARSAGIWASSDREGRFEATVLLRYSAGGDRKKLTTNELTNTLRELAQECGVIYAVALSKDGGRQQGVLLQSPLTTRLGRRYLLNIGRITVYDEKDMPREEKVNWVIL